MSRIPFVAVLWLWACGPPHSATPVEVGTGVDAFVPLADGAEVDIVSGPQGGFHIWMAVRAKEPLAPADVELVYSVLDAETGREVSLNGGRWTLRPNGEWLEAAGLLGLVPRPSDVAGRDVLLRVEAKDRDGRRGTDERRVRPRMP